MSPATNPRFVESTDAMRAAFTDAFDGLNADPLAPFDQAFRELAVDPFELFLVERVRPEASQKVVGEYRLAIRQWHEYMAKAGRHPACPNESHVRGFARWLRNETYDTDAESVHRNVRLLGRAYRFWQREPTLPHPEGYDPFADRPRQGNRQSAHSGWK